MTQHDLLHWYEAKLPARERKTRGHFSTPPQLVEQILDACGYTADHDLSHIRVLDPACGSGNFLAGATRRLIAYGTEAKRSSTSLARLVQRNIWGFDPDPVACFLAEMQVRAALVTQQMANVPGSRLHIHQADGLAFPWDKGAHVDLFLANPPYLAAKNNDLSVYRSAHQRGQSDSYLLFLYLALQIVRPGGWLGLVLPDPVLARANAAHARERLLAEATIHHLWHLADVFTAYVGAVVIIAQKQPSTPLHHISWQRERWRPNSAPKKAEVGAFPGGQHESGRRSGTISQVLLHLQPGAELRYLLSNMQGTLSERLYTHLHTGQASAIPHTLAFLGKFVSIRRGEELGKDSPLLHEFPPTPEQNKHEAWYPVLRGGSDIRPYGIPIAQHWIAHAHIMKPLDRYLAPKLLIVKSAGRLQATVDLQGHVVLQTLYILQLNEQTRAVTPPGGTPADRHTPAFSIEDELYFLLALLNSRLLQEYVYILHTAYKWVQPQIEQHVLTHLPVPGDPDYTEKVQIIKRARQMTFACSALPPVVELKEQNRGLYEEQERAICLLYQSAILGSRQPEPPLPDAIDEGVSLHG